MTPQSAYATRLAERRAALLQNDLQHQRVGYARLLVAGILLAMLGAYVVGSAGFPAWWMLLPLPPLIALGVWLRRLEETAADLSRAVLFYERAIARIEGRWAGTGTAGLRFLDDHHPYARDLDLFGEGSLFDLLCNARTPMGEDTLARWLLEPSTVAAVRQRHDAVLELTPRLDLHERFAVVADQLRAGVSRFAATSLAAWGARPARLQSRGLRAVAWVLAAAGLTALAAGVVVAAPSAAPSLDDQTLAALRLWFLFVIAVIGTVLWRLRHSIEPVIGEADAAASRLALIVGLLRIIEREAFRAPRLTELQAALATEGHPPSQQIARLQNLLRVADMRHNWFVKLLGPLVLFELHVAFRIEDWRRSAGPSVAGWLAAVGEVEALASLANYQHGRPAHALPEFVEGAPCFEGEALAHPLLHEPVANDVALVPPLQVLIISGSNMSGKSTLLRTIGINVVMARAGAPVCARRLRLAPLSVAASIWNQDSLREGRSRFYAEILRLKQIIDTSVQSPPALFLIDEFLHGTNSHDRLIGASAIVRALAGRGAIGLITTHDLALTRIAAELGAAAENVHFGDHLENGRLHFDYRMQPGVVTRSNAIELMKSIGLEI